MFKIGVRRRGRTPGQLKFGPEDDLYRELRKRVNEFFKRTGRKKRDCPQMYAKTALILGWFAASYVLLVFVATTWWQAVPLAISLRSRWRQSALIFSTTADMGLTRSTLGLIK